MRRQRGLDLARVGALCLGLPVAVLGSLAAEVPAKAATTFAAAVVASGTLPATARPPSSGRASDVPRFGDAIRLAGSNDRLPRPAGSQGRVNRGVPLPGMAGGPPRGVAPPGARPARSGRRPTNALPRRSGPNTGVGASPGEQQGAPVRPGRPFARPGRRNGTGPPRAGVNRNGQPVNGSRRQMPGAIAGGQNGPGPVPASRPFVPKGGTGASPARQPRQGSAQADPGPGPARAAASPAQYGSLPQSRPRQRTGFERLPDMPPQSGTPTQRPAGATPSGRALQSGPQRSNFGRVPSVSRGGNAAPAARRRSNRQPERYGVLPAPARGAPARNGQPSSGYDRLSNRDMAPDRASAQSFPARPAASAVSPAAKPATRRDAPGRRPARQPNDRRTASTRGGIYDAATDALDGAGAASSSVNAAPPGGLASPTRGPAGMPALPPRRGAPGAMPARPTGSANAQPGQPSRAAPRQPGGQAASSYQALPAEAARGRSASEVESDLPSPPRN